MFLSFSASSLARPSLITLGAPSTNSLASFNPKPVASLTALTTLILDEPAEVNSTSNSVFLLLRLRHQLHPAAATELLQLHQILLQLLLLNRLILKLTFL